jgi:hypothetical protein
VHHEKEDSAKKEFLYHLSRTDYEREFGTKYRRPGIFARILGFLIRLIPFGPTKILGYRTPTPEAEDHYFRSMDKAVAEYDELLARVNVGELDFPNRNFDTGRRTHRGDYALCDRTYLALLERLAKDRFRHLTPAVKADVLEFYSEPIPAVGALKPGDQEKLQKALAELKNISIATPRASATKKIQE